VQPPADETRANEIEVEVTASPGRTISGIQRKLLAIGQDGHFAPAGSAGFAPYIAKFNSENERVGSLVRNEALSLRWSAALLGDNEINKFEIAKVTVVDEIALIVTRFDRTERGEKLRLEDFAQILNRPSGRGGNGKYEASYEEVADVILQHSVRPDIDIARFFRRLVVFILVGNCDAHLKNFSLLETPVGLRLSPAYDIVNTALYDGFDQNIALTIDTRKPHLDQVTRELLTTFARSIGIPERAIQSVFSDLRGRVRRAAGILTPPRGEPPDGFVHRYAEIVDRACQRILAE
jgi:serine/threonine-protein kinase HipA